MKQFRIVGEPSSEGTSYKVQSMSGGLMSFTWRDEGEVLEDMTVPTWYATPQEAEAAVEKLMNAWRGEPFVYKTYSPNTMGTLGENPEQIKAEKP